MKILTKNYMKNLFGGKTITKVTRFDGWLSRTPGGEMIYSRYMCVEYSDGSIGYFSILGNPMYSSN